MQAVILAGGKSTRTYPLTLTKPKPLLKVGRKSLLEHNLDQLQGLVDEAILVIGYKGDMIREHFGKRYKKLALRYIQQREQLGTGHALLAAEPLLKNRFLVLMADDLYLKEDIRNCLKRKYSALAKKVSNPGSFGVFVVEDGRIIDVIEKPKLPVSNLANCGCYVLGKEIFDEIEGLEESPRNEYELTDALKNMALKESIEVVKARGWVPVVYPWDLFGVKKLFGIKGNAIGKNCTVKGKIRNSIIMDHSKVIGNIQDSIIGEHVIFKGSIISRKNVFSIVKGANVKVLNKLGAVVGDHCRLENVEVYHGVKIWPHKNIKNKVIKVDVE